MFLDASAIIAIIAAEVDGPELMAKLNQAERVYTSAIAVYEATLGLSRIGHIPVSESAAVLMDFLSRLHAEIVPIGAEIGHSAIDAFTRFGRGQHPARLNMGDCFAYACARALGVSLLFKGDDFALTDIAAA